MAFVYGAYNDKTRSYIAVDLDNINYTLYGASAEQYQQSNDPKGDAVYTEDLQNLNRNQYPSLSNITDAQIAKYFSGENPLGIAEQYRYEGQELLWKNLGSAEKQEYLDGKYGDAWRTFNSENSATLLDDSNYGPGNEAYDLNLNLGFGNDFGKPPELLSGGSGAAPSSVLKYPIDMDLKVQDHMAITVAEYVPAKTLPKINQRTDSGQFVRTRNAQLKETIIIPMPNAMRSADRTNFGGAEMSGVTGELFDPTAQAFLGTEFEGKLSDTLSTIVDAATKAGGGLLEAGRAAAGSGYIKRKFLLQGAAALANTINLNVDVGEVIRRTTGAVENPNFELLFQGPSLRSFTFNIRFTPRSKSEAARVRRIIRVLKRSMSVKRRSSFFEGQGGENLLLGTPNVFRLQYRRGSTTNEEIKGLNKFKTCALTDLEVDYSGASGRWAAYGPDSQPVTTLVIMTFKELVPVYEEDYENSGFAYDDVGF
ncbi:baseplate tail tube cap [Synechococcus virus S-PRM1]|uniref:Baseplate tail tube cap n=1 Tax=Synechococcus virus S-PRM1 TaxID=2100130 RepID=A0A346FKB0_9CAUD|nr:baseplate tail tube cap [Synechococcus virus S-PRM1]AXN58415.1 baseplate tail tube cap [Synechococcus virus S-PRM1]